MFKKQVKCSECGFFGIPHGLGVSKSLEISQQDRLNLPLWFREAQSIFAGCIRGQDYLIAGSSSPNDPIPVKDIVNNASLPRKCVYYYAYNPGYTPEQHLELLRERTQRRFLIIVALLSAAVGAAIATLVNLAW